MKRIVLNKCPFCNGKVRVIKPFSPIFPMYYVKCANCGARQKPVQVTRQVPDAAAIQQAIDNWNNPVTE